MRTASTAIIIQNSKILSITRSSGKLSLIGGKVEHGETPKEAIIRECKEETGLNIEECQEVFVDVNLPEFPGGEPFLVHCFLVIKYDGKLSSSEEGELSWVQKEDLLSDKAAFPEYNRNAFLKIERD